MLPQRAAVAFVLAKVAVNGAVVERDPVVFAQVGAYLFGTEFAADKGVDVLNQLRIELIGLSLTLFDSLALPLGFFGAVLLPLGAVPSDFAADGAFVAVKLFGDFGDGAVAGQVLDVVSFALGQLRVAHGNLSCRKGRMLPHTGLFLLGKVALQMRIRRRLKQGVIMAKTNNKPETAETAAPSFEDIKAELDAVQAELAAARNDVEMLTTALEKAEDDKKALSAELAELKVQHTQRAADALADSRDVMLVSTGADGKEFWRGGLLFDGGWREVKRAEVGEAVWKAICAEPMLQRKAVE